MGFTKNEYQFSGKVGLAVFRIKKDGTSTVANLPKKRKSDSKLQKAHLARVKKAARYWNEVKKFPELLAEYKKGITTKKTSTYNVVVSDFMNPPEIHYINSDKYNGDIGDQILIKATDDFKVVTVTVEIYNSKGKLIESRAAVPYPRRPKLWKYFATVTNADSGSVIKVTAFDTPNHATSAEITVGQPKEAVRFLG
jgi:hypothetical protein